MIIQTGTKLIVLLTDIHDQEGNRLVKHFWPESTANSRSYSESNVKVNYVKSGVVSFIFNFQFSNSCHSWAEKMIHLKFKNKNLI
ncbi:unnamed protein product [Onchocerca flexuosa]|uniref:Tyrosine-protein phosphatase domain-containing protein n=1 Tax=Onchocerca flexuosa TaxID=387005 RepID=A0A183HMZ5_9BILA|nr:unnamed protein product [Onchocerca flexuosa]